MRFISKVLKDTLNEKFPDATEDELVKVCFPHPEVLLLLKDSLELSSVLLSGILVGLTLSCFLSTESCFSLFYFPFKQSFSQLSFVLLLFLASPPLVSCTPF